MVPVMIGVALAPWLNLGAKPACLGLGVRHAAGHARRETHPLFLVRALRGGTTARTGPHPARDVEEPKAARVPTGLAAIAEQPDAVLLKAHPTWVALGGSSRATSMRCGVR